MFRLDVTCLSLAVLLLACADRPRHSELDEALSAPSLEVSVDLRRSSAFVQTDDGFIASRPVGGLRRALGTLSASLVLANESKEPRVQLVPRSGPASFASWGPGTAFGDAIVYAGAKGSAAHVLKVDARGVKDDIVLTRTLGDSLRFEWSLELAEGLKARREESGSIAIEDGAGRRFTIPAPVIKTPKGSRTDLVRLTLEGQRLVLEAHGLDALEYPLTIDPSIVVTTSAEFATGNLEDLLNVTGGSLQRPLVGVGLGSVTNSLVTLPTARSGLDAVFANGLVYVTGGLGAGDTTLGEVLTAPVGSSGDVGAFTSSTNQIAPRHGHASVVFNGVLYVIGGAVQGVGNLFSIQMSKLNSAGLPGPFTSTTNVPFARTGHCAVASNGYLYVAGGDGVSSFSDVQVARFNPDGTLGAFSATTPLPYATANHACVVSSGRFYVIGGFDLNAQSSASGVVNSAPINADGRLGAFVSTASVPGRTGHRAVVMNGALYVLGGQPNSGDVAGTINADGSISAFAPVPTMSGNRRRFAAIASQNTITVIGGTDGAMPMASLASAPFLPTLPTRAFDTSTSSLLTARTDHAALSYRGQLYLVGGIGPVSPISTIEAAPWVESTGVGTFSSFLLPSTRHRHSANAANGWMYVVGGISGMISTQVSIAGGAFALDGGLMQFRDDFAALPESRTDHTSEIHQSTMYVIGGLGTQSFVPRDTVLRAAIDNSGNIGAFTTTSPLPSPRWDHASLIHGNRLYVIGGAVDAGVPVTNEVLVAPINADGSLGAFSTTTPLPAPRRGHTAVAASGFLQVMQGADATNTIQGNSFTAPFLADGGLGSFVTEPTPGIARQGHGGALFGTRSFVIGGRTASAVSANVATAAVAGLGSMGPFQTGAAPVFDSPGRRALAAVAHNGALYVLGGLNGSGRPVSIRQATIGVDGALSAFTSSATSLPGPREGLAAAVWRDRLYIAGGFDGSQNLSSVSVAAINANRTLGAFAPTSAFSGGRSRLALVAAQGFLFVVGGNGSSTLADVQRATINPDGTLGAFSLAGTMLQARSAHAAVVNDGWLYVIGGSGSTPFLSSIEAAPINANGSLGAFVPRGSMLDGRAGHVAFVEGGHLFIVGGSVGVFTDDVSVAPLLSNGGLGSFRSATRLPVVRSEPGLAVWGGRAFVVGGQSASNGFLDDVQVAPVLTSPARSSYSRLFDLGGPARVSSLLVNGTGGLVRVQTSAAGSTGAFSQPVERGFADAGTPVPIADTSTQYVWAQLSVDDTANQVVNPDTSFRQLTDLTLAYDLNPVLSPSLASVPPRGTVSFTCAGGSGSGFAFSFDVNSSMAMVSPTGVYQAGANPNASSGLLDVLRCTDSAGVSETANIQVGPGVFIAPATATVAPRASLQLGADGGSRAGFQWSLTSAPSGGAIDGGSGFYVAGAMGNVSDQVLVVDSLGNTATMAVSVGPIVSITPASISVPPRGRASFAADGGGGSFVWSLVANGSDGGLDGGDYVAGPIANTTDAVRVTDQFGSVATAVVTVGPPVTIAPALVSLVPRGAQQFLATGGADGGYRWSLGSNQSGGSISATGAYLAGATGSVVDIVEATDPLGNVGSTSVTVGPAISVMPATPSTTPLGSLSFSAMGGSGMGFVFSFVTNASGGTLSSSGMYRAGAGTPNDAGVILVRDRVQVVDSLVNTFAFDIEVTNGIAVTPRAVSIPPRGSVDLTATGGSMPYVWSVMTNRSGGALDAGVSTARYTAGTVGSVVDEVQVVDSLGSPFVTTVTVTAPLAIVAPQRSTTPRGTLTFMGQGGSAMGLTWALSTNASGGSIAANGVYVAGTTGSVTDVVQLTDSLGNVATVDVMVGPAVSISPSTLSVTPRGSQAFTASGGTNTGFTWTLVNRSGGTIDPFGGQYTAGPTGNVTDVVGVRDSLGNTATVDVLVSSGLTIMPATPRTPPRGSLAFSVQGGTPPYRWELETNNSGGSIDGGAYQAGPTPLMSDVVKVTDGLMNSKSIAVVVTAGVSLTPSDPTVGPGGAVSFAASGGSETGFVWSLPTNGSGASISSDGTYVAGSTGATLDRVQVVDSLGNVATASVSVVAGGAVNQVPFAQRPPVSGWSCGCSSGNGSGAGWLVAIGALVGLRRRRSRLAVLSMALVLSVPALAAPAAKKKKAPPPVVAPVAPAAPVVVEPPPPVVAPAPAPAPKPDRLSVAVLDVDVTVPQEKLDASAFSEMLVNSIDGAGMFRVISSKEIVTLIGLERQRQLLGCSEDTSCMAEIASALGSDLVASATVGKVGSTYLVSVRLIDGRTSRTVARANAEANDANLLLKAVWTSSQEMLDKYGATLPPAEAAKWANRPKQEAPQQLVAADATPNFFGVAAGVVGGLQVLSEAGKRGSIGAEVDVTFRRGHFDASAGLIIGPNLGVRIAATWALLASRFRLGVGLRGAGYPGLGLWGGGVVTTGEFTIVSVWSVFAAGGAEIYPAPGTPVVVLLGTLGTAVRF